MNAHLPLVRHILEEKLGSQRKPRHVYAMCFIMILSLLLRANIAYAACASDGATTPVTVTDEGADIPGSRQLVDGIGTTIDTATPNQIKVNAAAPAALVIGTYSSGSAFTPSANSFTSVTSATQINLPGTSSIPVGSVIGLTIGGSQGTTSVVTNGGAANENIKFNGSLTNTSISIKNGDEIFLANAGSGVWLVTSFLPQGGTSGSTWTVSQGGTGGATASAARTSLSAAASGANSDITSLTGLTTALPITEGGTGGTNAGAARSNLSAAASGANSDITSLTGLTTPLPITVGGTNATSAASARSNLGAAASGANSDITSLTGLTTALPVTEGGTGATTASGARTNLSAAESGANSDITSLTGLTTALPVSEGGTGSTSASGARTNLSAAASGANSDITSLTGLTTALPVSEGGTGATTQQGAADAILNFASLAIGDLVHFDGTNWSRLPGNATTTRKFLQQHGNGSAVTSTGWDQLTTGDLPAGSFDAISPLTTLGDWLYGGASGAGTRLAGNTTTTKKVPIQVGTGSVSAAPTLGTLQDLCGTGGTGITISGNVISATGGGGGGNVSFGGNGADGAVSISSNTDTDGRNYNATTYDVTGSSITHTCPGCVISASSTLNIDSTCIIAANVSSQTKRYFGIANPGGYGATLSNSAGGVGMGPAPGLAGSNSTAAAAAGGGAGSAGSGGDGGGSHIGATVNNFWLGGQVGSDQHFSGNLNGSGGGGGGAGITGTGGDGGGGASHLVLLTAGGFTGTGSILAQGNSGSDATTAGHGGGGGGGGTIEAYDANGNLPALTFDVSGGAAGTSAGGAPDSGGGGGGYIMVQATGTTSAATYTVTGGSSAGNAGQDGLATQIANVTPTLPQIAYNHINGCQAMKNLAWITIAKRALAGVDPSLHKNHILSWDGTKPGGMQPQEYIASTYCKQGKFRDLCTALKYGGDEHTAEFCNVWNIEQVKRSFEDFKHSPMPKQSMLEAETCDDTDLLLPKV